MNSAGTGEYAHRLPAADVLTLQESLARWRRFYAEAIQQLVDERLHGRELEARIKELERLQKDTNRLRDFAEQVASGMYRMTDMEGAQSGAHRGDTLEVREHDDDPWHFARVAIETKEESK